MCRICCDEKPIKTGFGNLDSAIGGFAPGDLIILSSCTSVGKSAFMLNMALNMAMDGYKIYIDNLEDSSACIVHRMLSRLSGVNLSSSRIVRRDSEHRFAIQSAVDKIKSLEFHINDKKGKSIVEIKNDIFEAKKIHDIEIAFIDPIDRINGMIGEIDDPNSQIAWTLSSIARELNIPIVVATQLTFPEERHDSRPRIQDLRQSETLEAVASVICLCYRHAHFYRAYAEAPEFEVDIVKNAHGPTDILEFHADLEHMHFQEWDELKHGVFRHFQSNTSEN